MFRVSIRCYYVPTEHTQKKLVSLPLDLFLYFANPLDYKIVITKPVHNNKLNNI